MATLIPKYTQVTTANRTIAQKFAETISVLDYGATGDGSTDDSVAIQAAINTGKAVYFPAGTYKCNVTINNRTILFGDGSTKSKITPFANTSAAFLYTYAAMSTPGGLSFWNYHSIVRDLGFYGSSATSGGSIGFSFGTNSPTVYTTNAESANNVQFYNCFFSGNYIGVQFPLGNIGSAFYSCGFASNYYGVYSVDNNSGGGGIMHAGNKYFYNGEFHSNTCAVYINNQTDGFGAIEFRDTIFEVNNLVLWFNSTIATSFVPVSFKNCWNESNGSLTYTLGNVTIDSWSGTTRTTQSVSNLQPWIIGADITNFDGCFFTGVKLTKDNSQIYVKNSRVENQASNLGALITVTGTNSRIYLENTTSNAAAINDVNVVYVGVNSMSKPNITDTFFASARSRVLPLNYNKTSGANKGTGLSLDFTTAQGYTGTSSGTGTVVSDGVKYTSCNEVTYNFTASNQFILFTNTANSNATGWWACTFDVKVTSSTASGTNFYIFDGGANQFMLKTIPNDSKWHTIGGVGYYPGTATAQLYIGGAINNTTFRVSAYQMIPFSTRSDAEEFLASRTYLA